MLPNIWFIDTYSLCIFIGVALCFLLLRKYLRKIGKNDMYIYDLLIVACITIIGGLLSSSLFQSLFDFIGGNGREFFSAMTFYGGLIGGVIIFVVLYKIVIKARYPYERIGESMYVIAPACITLAHGIGRIGCFMAGCCYGKETDSFLGVMFPGHLHKVYPTQLFESAFLLILCALLAYLAFKKNYRDCMSIYLACYGIFRFFIEFIRGDERGGLSFNLTPSQFISILAIIASIVLAILTKKNIIKTEQKNSEA